jgi:hypothetical protein
MSKTNCVNIETNEENCPCETLDCERHAVCCECILADGLPACLKAKIKESQKFRHHITGLVEQARMSA